MRKKYHTTGDVPIQDDVIYVTRQIDRYVQQLLEDPDRRHVPVLYGCRQSGKSSLAIRVRNTLEAKNRVAYIDFRYIVSTESSHRDPTAFLKQLCHQISE